MILSDWILQGSRKKTAFLGRIRENHFLASPVSLLGPLCPIFLSKVTRIGFHPSVPSHIWQDCGIRFSPPHYPQWLLRFIEMVTTSFKSCLSCKVTYHSFLLRDPRICSLVGDKPHLSPGLVTLISVSDCIFTAIFNSAFPYKFLWVHLTYR